MRFKQALALFAIALWWGSLTAIGFIVVPMLFAHLATPAVAGAMAAKLFTAQSWVSIGCALVLLLSTSNRAATPVPPAPAAIFFIVTGLLLALLGEYAVAPRIVARENLKLWHAVGSGMYLLQWLCASALLWRQARLRAARQEAA
jgi:glucan phosphoethanolaminetransferase (alkaline phosphatase superfamily)